MSSKVKLIKNSLNIPKPAKMVYIPKKNALESQLEAKFEPSSYKTIKGEYKKAIKQ
ncbi:hypothetical protein [Clostridium estertheticum]|uniref:hypothetical protein n=1 Tax=Clostridium estertheticum TaxID=238834 RepID=UPI001CF371F9|nr:hypothetical protein [Clostridium estertheticum]MCB2358772.1 hypothetical protein [Clostridium estertheticum]